MVPLMGGGRLIDGNEYEVPSQSFFSVIESHRIKYQSFSVNLEEPRPTKAVGCGFSANKMLLKEQSGFKFLLYIA